MVWGVDFHISGSPVSCSWEGEFLLDRNCFLLEVMGRGWATQFPILCALRPWPQTKRSPSTRHPQSPLHKHWWDTLVLIMSRNSSLAKHNLDRNIKCRWANEFCITMFTWLLAKIWELQGPHGCLPASVYIYTCCICDSSLLLDGITKLIHKIS